MQRLIQLFAILVLCAWSTVSMAQSCTPVVRSTETIARWTDPHPATGDFKLPLPGAMSIVFTVVPLGSSQVWGNEKSTYVMGSSELRVFETPLKVRVGSSIFDLSKKTILMIGKYELSKAQYAAVLGSGFEDGIEILEQKSGDPRVKEVLAEYVRPGGPCQRVLTREIVDLLAEPVTFLRYSDFVEVIDRINELCITTPNCRRLLTQLGSNPDFPGFVRLPSEIEWEFIARGGGAFVRGEFPKNVLQADLPPFAPGSTIDDYAHVNNAPPRLTAIGSREPLFGFYDLLGNADELMQNPFTSENGFGAVGAYVARGGHYRLPTEEVRVSKRVELTVFRRDEITGEFYPQAFPYTGIRLMIGLPVAGATGRTGSDELAQWFAEGWEPVEVAGDIAGSTVAEANSLGRLVQTGLRAADEVDVNDAADLFSFDLLEFAKLVIKPSDVNGPATLRIIDDSSNVFGEIDLTGGTSQKSLTTAALVPKRYYIEITSRPGVVSEVKYALDLVREVVPDTGIERPETDALASATPVSERRSVSVDGYVGEGDRVDTYPISVNDALGGIKVEASDFVGEITLRYLDDRQRVITEMVGTGGTTLQLMAPAKINSRGFIQVAAGDRNSSTYKLEMTSARTYDPAFVTQASNTSNPGAAKRTYEGFLSTGTPRLLLPVNLVSPARLRVELTGLAANVDLDILDKDAKRVTSDHRRPGAQPEFFEREMDAGRYFLQITLDKSEAFSDFSLMFDTAAIQGTTIASADPAALRRTAEQLGVLTDYGASVNGSSKGETKYYKMTVTGVDNVVVVDLVVSSSTADLDLFLEDANGNVVAKSANSGASNEVIKYRANSGQYFVRVASVGGAGNIYYSLSTSRMGVPRDPTATWDGLVETNGDWKVFKNGDTCSMATAAKSIAPSIGWRAELPYFFVSVDRGADAVGIQMDYSAGKDGAGIYTGVPVVTAYFSNGKSQRVAGVWGEDHWFKPVSACDGGMCVDNEAIRSFRNGKYLRVTGATQDGEEAFFEYSLEGYTRSAKRINDLCGGRADWVWSNG